MCVMAQAINMIVGGIHACPRQQLANKLILIKSCWIHSLLPEVTDECALASAWGSNGADVSFSASRSHSLAYLVLGRTARVVAA